MCENGSEHLRPVDLETYASKIKTVCQSKRELQVQKTIRSTTMFTGNRYETRMLLSEPEPTPKLQKNYSLA